ncbi:PqqD family protein [Sphingomonas sp. QA11]|uniref:PqqD family protein n=1 Tax=Sphingomonas sp. QA11 TaxID=2950605 RepID=UPI00234AEBCC|nr:PqqD family protein [Sphingomonas sp. QA11]WCM26974.1 PqqD family protein [Sphingomonas sp. QA11]
MTASLLLEPADDAICTQVEDEIVFLTMNSETPVYFGLRGSGVRIWQLIDERKYSADDIVEIMTQEFDVDIATARTDVARVVADLETHGVLRRR